MPTYNNYEKWKLLKIAKISKRGGIWGYKYVKYGATGDCKKTSVYDLNKIKSIDLY